MTFTKIRQTLRVKEKPKYTLQEISAFMDSQFRSKFSKSAYQAIKRITIIHPAKRDGDICKSILGEDGTIITSTHTIYKNCIDTLAKISGVDHSTNDQEFVNLDPLSSEEVQELQ